MHTEPQDFFVFKVFQNHTSVQASVKPRDLIHFRRFLCDKKCLIPQLLTGLVKSVVKYTKRSCKVEHFPQTP